MFIQFDWIDVVSVAFITAYAILIFRRGFLAETFEFLSFTTSLLGAVILFPWLAKVLERLFIPVDFSNTISFLFIWIAVELFCLTLFKELFRQLPMALILSKFNRIWGIIPNVLASLSILSFTGILLIILPTPSSVKTSVVQSRIIGTIIPLTSAFNTPLETAFSQSVRDSLVIVSQKKGPEFVRLSLPKVSSRPDQEAEKTLFELVNQERQKRGLSILVPDTGLAKVARAHSSDMFKRNYFGHIDPDGLNPLERVSLAGIYVSSLGENISFAPDVLTAHNSFMSSTEHRANILRKKYSRLGVGVVDSGLYGEMFTELFAN